MIAEASTPHKCELEAIAYDAICFRSFVEAVSQHPKSALIILGSVPFISLFVVESNDILSLYFPEYRDMLKSQHENLIRASRHRAKLLMSNSATITSITDELGKIGDQHREHFNRPNVGLLGPVKRLIQPDIGLSTYDGHLFSTTHVTTFDFGSHSDGPLSIKELERVVFEMSYELGSYIATINSLFSLPQVKILDSEVALAGKTEMKDIKMEALLNRGAIGSIEPNYPAGLTVVLAHVNYLYFIFRQLIPATLPTLFKLKFLCAFHAEASIRAIQQILQSRDNLPEAAAYVFRKALGNKEARWIRKQKQLRNFLVHYQLDTNSRNKTSAEASYPDTIEILLRDRSYQEVDILLDRYLDILSRTLEDGFQLSDSTFWYGRVT